jgi:hypothetical protein
MVENKCPAVSRGAAENADFSAQKITISAGWRSAASGLTPPAEIVN